MYISRVEVDTYNRRTIRELSHVGAYHNWVEHSFPHEFKNGERSRKLWRLDNINNRTYLLIISQIKPSIPHLEKFGVSGTGQTKNYDNFLGQLENNLKARFRVTLNPVKSIRETEEAKRGRVVPHVTIDQQRKFLLDRSEKNGFSLENNEFQIVERGYVRFKKKNNREIQLAKATYEGHLTVIDKDRFIETLTLGFGKKKAYGFGMLTVIPYR